MARTWKNPIGPGWVSAYLLFLFVLVAVGYGPMVSNGDYWRTAQNMGVNLDHPAILADYYQFNTLATLPKSTLGILVALLYWPQRWLGFHGYHTVLLFYALNAIFFCGLYRLLQAKDTDRLRGPMLLMFSALYLVFGFYFKSLYEESMVLALSPWMNLGLYRIKYQGNSKVFTLASVLLVFAKVQMIFVLPVVIAIFYYCDASVFVCKSKRFSCEVIILAGMAAFHFSGIYAQINDYDRFYNGMGWSLQKVSTWPARNTPDRLRYFYQHQTQLQLRSKTFEPDPVDPRLGTSFFPTELPQVRGKLDDRHKAAILKILFRGRMVALCGFLIAHPGVAIQYFKNIYWVALDSDYAVRYLRPQIAIHVPIGVMLAGLSNGVLYWAGYVFYCTGMVLLVVKPNGLKWMVIGYFFLGAPVFAVLGDGFYEFEKHMHVYLMLIPLLLSFPFYKVRCASAPL